MELARSTNRKRFFIGQAGPAFSRPRPCNGTLQKRPSMGAAGSEFGRWAEEFPDGSGLPAWHSDGFRARQHLSPRWNFLILGPSTSSSIHPGQDCPIISDYRPKVIYPPPASAVNDRSIPQWASTKGDFTDAMRLHAQDGSKGGFAWDEPEQIVFPPTRPALPV